MEMPSQARRSASGHSEPSDSPSVVEEGNPVKFLRGDVDCIVMKALARDPNDRYQSVSELKRDMERFVGGLPIEAAPPSVFYQLRKHVMRHRVITSVASLACHHVLSRIDHCDSIWARRQRTIASGLDMQSELKTERDRAVVAE